MKYKDLNDYELLYMISDGQDDNVTLLLEKYEPIISKKSVKWLSVLKKMNLDMEDLEQEVRVAFIEAIRSYRDDEGATFFTYINNVVDNKIYSLVRQLETNKNKALQQTSSLFLSNYKDNGLGFKIDKVVDFRENIEEKAEVLEMEEAVYKFLNTLSIDRACLFELYLNGYSNEVIANCLGIEKENVYKRISTIKKKLKKYLLDLGLLVV